MKHNFFSQYQQDECINVLFKKLDEGWFLDIGAHDGITFSNTCYFEKVRNWKGICIEPNPDVVAELKNNRSCIIEDVCITNENRDVTFRKVQGKGEADMLSGILDFFDQKHIDRIDYTIKNTECGEYEDIIIKSRNLNDLLNEHKHTKIDYCSIDTEGAELIILQNIDFKKIDITSFTIEKNNKDNHVRNFLKSKGYLCIHGRLDDYFVKKGTPRIFHFFCAIKWAWFKSTIKIIKQIIENRLKKE